MRRSGTSNIWGESKHDIAEKHHMVTGKCEHKEAISWKRGPWIKWWSKETCGPLWTDLLEQRKGHVSTQIFKRLLRFSSTRSPTSSLSLPVCLPYFYCIWETTFSTFSLAWHLIFSNAIYNCHVVWFFIFLRKPVGMIFLAEILR